MSRNSRINMSRNSRTNLNAPSNEVGEVNERSFKTALKKVRRKTLKCCEKKTVVQCC